MSDPAKKTDGTDASILSVISFTRMAEDRGGLGRVSLGPPF